MPSSITMAAFSMTAGLLFSVVLPAAANTKRDSDGWFSGRGTFYGGLGDPWTIHSGSCGCVGCCEHGACGFEICSSPVAGFMANGGDDSHGFECIVHDVLKLYGYIDSQVGTGDMVAASSDCNPDFGGSCGRCYEVKCDPGSVKDNYGGVYDRKSNCYDSAESVVVQVIDSCPCDYPPNAYSNKRWCCGDRYHLDLSIWAFERLANTKWGVIPLKVRTVACSDHPVKMAGLRGPKAIDGTPRPSYVQDRRPYAVRENQK